MTAVWEEMRDGITTLFGSRIMVGVLVCLSVVMLGMGAIQVVWVPYLWRAFEVGPEGLGMVDSAHGVGMVVGGVGLGYLSARLSKRVMIAWCLTVVGLLIAGMGLAPRFGFVLALSLGVGVVIVPAQSGLMTIMQLSVPDLKRGRVGSALNALTTAASLLSMGMAATFAEVVGLGSIYVISGLIIMAGGLVGFAALREPQPDPSERSFEKV